MANSDRLTIIENYANRRLYNAGTFTLVTLDAAREAWRAQDRSTVRGQCLDSAADIQRAMIVGDILNEGEVVVEINGSPVLGKYNVWRGTITVTTIHGIKKAVVGALPPDHLARIMVRELAQDTKA